MSARERRSPLALRLICLLSATMLLVGVAFVGISPSQESSRKVTSKTSPVYPELAKKMHLRGKVKVEVTVNTAGNVTSAKFVGGNPVFETSSVDAVRQWKFESSAAASTETITLEFSGD
jgi:TonB family protein